MLLLHFVEAFGKLGTQARVFSQRDTAKGKIFLKHSSVALLSLTSKFAVYLMPVFLNDL